MRLIEILLPTTHNDGRPIPAVEFERLRKLLTERFGGATFFSRAPAEGTWRSAGRAVERDTIVVMEVMTGVVETDWWRKLKTDLEDRFSQSAVVIRSTEVDLL